MQKKMVLVMVAALTFSLAGCGSKAAATEESTVISEETASEEAAENLTTEEVTSEEMSEDELTLGKVKATDGDRITIALGELKLQEAPNGKPENNDNSSAEKPDGKALGGGKSGGKGKHPAMPFEESGEEITVTVDDTVAVEVQDKADSTTAETGSIDNIEEGSIVSIIYDENGTVTKLCVMKMGAPKGEKGGNPHDNTEESTEDPTRG